MKKHVLLIGFLFLSCAAWAQNKTLGVGVATPNANAALHVESPTGNQGFILPRLTTTQRTAPGFVSVLGAADNGLMVYDTDLNTVFIWDGAAWKTSAQVAGGPKLVLPYVDTVGSAPNNSNLLRLVYAGSAAENVGVAHFENLNPNSGFSAIFGRTNSTTNGVADFVINNPTNNNDGISSVTNGVGTAGRFTINNPSSLMHAVFAQTNGDSTGAAVFGNNVGNGFGVFGRSASSKFAGAAVYGEHVGTGDAAGAFRVSNAGNNYAALYGETNGGGAALFANQLGTGRGGQFQIGNSSNVNAALRSYTSGLGNAGFFTINNSSNGNPSILAVTDGQGAAGVFSQTNTEVWSPALQGITDGQGAAIAGTATSTSTNANASEFVVQNPANPRHAVRAETLGTGSSGYFSNNNGANASAALMATTNGTGAALQAETASGFAAFFAQHTGSTNGNAAIFDITNASNTYPTLQANTLGTGSAINAQINNASSGASAIFAQTNGNGTGGHFEITGSGSGSAIYAGTSGSGNGLFINHTGGSGNLAIFQNNGSNVVRVDKNGQGFFNGGTTNSGADVAEMFDVEGERHTYEPGDVLVISESTDRTVEKSTFANSTKVAGVYATKPGVKLTERNLDDNLDDLVPMGVIGVIPTKVCIQNGPIKRGDLLVTSSKQGHAMKAVPAIINGIEVYPTGAILGKALENFDGKETGLIKVLVNVK